jgi:ATP/maltotriose-dependent transcriptional regulator MalT
MPAVAPDLPLEREREIAALDALLTGAAAGHGGALVLEAPAGLGKSALAARVSANGMRF